MRNALKCKPASGHSAGWPMAGGAKPQKWRSPARAALSSLRCGLSFRMSQLTPKAECPLSAYTFANRPARFVVFVTWAWEGQRLATY